MAKMCGLKIRAVKSWGGGLVGEHAEFGSVQLGDHSQKPEKKKGGDRRPGGDTGGVGNCKKTPSWFVLSVGETLARRG